MSDVDATIPADNVLVAKSDMRDNFATIKAELEGLERLTSVPWQIAIGTLSI